MFSDFVPQPLITSKTSTLDTSRYGPLGTVLLSCINAVIVPKSTIQEINGNLYCGWRQVGPFLLEESTFCGLRAAVFGYENS